MKAIEEVGFSKTTKFVLSSFLQLLAPLFFLPPIRQFFLTSLGAKIGKDSIIMNLKFINAYHKGFAFLNIGNNCFIGEECLFDLYDEIKIQDNVSFGPRVTVLTHTNVGYKDHPLQKVLPKSSQKVVFKSGCFIGASSTILQGVTIGKRSIVAAGSVVTASVRDNSLYAGVPAKFVRTLKSGK